MQRQGLPKRFSEVRPHQISDTIGWVYIPSGMTPYLVFQARIKDFSRDDLDQNITIERRLLPIRVMRSTNMLVPIDSIPLAIQVKSRTHRLRAEEIAKITTVSKRDILAVERDIIDALKGGPLQSNQIRQLLVFTYSDPRRAQKVRDNMQESIALALHHLLAIGEVVKTLPGVKLNFDGYAYALRSQYMPEVQYDPLPEEEFLLELAKVYFRAAGPAPASDFAWWANLEIIDAMQGISLANLKPLMIEGSDVRHYLPRDLHEEILDFRPSKKREVTFVPWQDNYTSYYPNPSAIIPREIHKKIVAGSYGPTSTILVGGEVIGRWSFNTNTERLYWDVFSRQPKGTLSEIDRNARALTAFIQLNLSEFRLYHSTDNRMESELRFRPRTMAKMSSLACL